MSRGSVSHSYEYIPNYSTAIQQIIPERFVLKIRQQPVQTRLSTHNERDRRPLDPPPIVQIELDNSNPQETQDFLQNPYLFMCVSLVNASTHEDIIHSTQNTLSGQTSSSMYKLKDINNHDGGFFVFGDLSVKLEGQFRLKFSMFEISTYGATNLKSIYSNVFQVYPSKTFPGMLESTFLSRSFSDQGVRIRIRKEHRVQMTGSRKRKLSSQDDALELADERGTHPYSQHPHHNHQPHQSSMLSPYTNASSTIYPPQNRSPWPSLLDYDHLQQRRRSSMNSSMTSNSDSRRSSYHHLQHIDHRPSVPYSPPHQSYDHHRPNNNGRGPEHAYYDHSRQHLHPHHPHPHPHHQQQNYAYYSHNNPHNYHRDSMIPSPPPQSSLFKSETSRRLSLDDTLPLRRQSADPRYDSTHQQQQLSGPRRLSLQQYYARLANQAPPPPPLATSSTTPTHTSSPLNEEIIHLPPLRSVVPQTAASPQYKRPSQEGIVEVDAAVAMMQLASRRQLQQQQEKGRYSA
ncbi:unnamed protein product [Mucor circinelloides]